jgi:hypothetical protein
MDCEVDKLDRSWAVLFGGLTEHGHFGLVARHDKFGRRFDTAKQLHGIFQGGMDMGLRRQVVQQTLAPLGL